jgi:lipopolysaccharide/colanic/teichoic acid biosynthesis glycosyltransferase
MHDLTNLPVDRVMTPAWAIFDCRVATEQQNAMPTPTVGPKVRQYLRLRALIEWSVAFALLVAAAPILLALGLIVGLTSEGPIVYSQWRVGRSGKPFRIYKLRTMTHRCETLTGPVWAIADDPRMTRVGRWLRDSHLDELPQLWNVLCGQMSLIGPRPERPEIAARIEQTLPEFRHRLLVRPGITGLAQMRLPADSDLDTVRRKLALDLYYIQHLSPLLDARLVVSTPLRFFGDIALSMSRSIARPIAAQVPITAQEDSALPHANPVAGTRQPVVAANLADELCVAA